MLSHPREVVEGDRGSVCRNNQIAQVKRCWLAVADSVGGRNVLLGRSRARAL
jgi:hypothetical protein